MWTAEGRPPTATMSASGDDDQAVDGPPAHNRARSAHRPAGEKWGHGGERGSRVLGVTLAEGLRQRVIDVTLNRSLTRGRTL
jgi:hypothetical protein